MLRFQPRVEALEARLVPAIDLPAGFQQTQFATGLAQPTAMEFAPDGRLFVAEKGGDLRVIDAGGNLLATPFLSVAVNSASERGLIGVTLDPNFASNGFVYVYYTGASPIRNQVSRFTADPGDPNVALGGSEVVLLGNIPSPGGNHNGGALHFGLDGMLYIAVGDGGSTPQNAPKFNSLSGKILRIEPDGDIPPDNPFVNKQDARGEIWARGFRNPFTFAVNPVNGKIFVNDVGQSSFEEINRLIKGKHYGWPAVEGKSATHPNLQNPIYVYAHVSGSSNAITGGVFYTATEFPAQYQGKYFFADFARGFIRRLNTTTNKAAGFATGASGPVDLDVGADGNLYYLSVTTGKVFKISLV